MVRTFPKVYMELDFYFLFLQEQIKDIIIITPQMGRGKINQCVLKSSGTLRRIDVGH
jgi:hypothetical protein